MVVESWVDLCEPEVHYIRKRYTLIVVSKAVTEPKVALAGVMLEDSFAWFRASMVTFNAESMVVSFSFPFCRRDLEVIVVTKVEGRCSVHTARP